MSFRSTAAILALAAFTATGFAGPLAPPAGPIASTGKTLTEVEPRTAINVSNTPGSSSSLFVITQPGSYYLPANITVPTGKNGIEITASNVTVDLNGFTITGQTGSSIGIYASDRQSLRITNGSISGMGTYGIYLTSASIAPKQQTIDHVSVRNCGSDGIEFSDGMISDCQVTGNDGIGIFIYRTHSTIVERCTVSGNSSYGIDMYVGTMRDCSATGNGATGLYCSMGTITGCFSSKNDVGFGGDGVNLTNCTAYDNTTTGISVGGNALVRNNTVTADAIVAGTVGIQVANWNGTRVEGNNIVRYSTGIKVYTANNMIVGNTLDNCTTAIDAVANNRIGAILTGTASPAIVGNSGGGLGVTDPFANIRY
jgi:hypothetical protein